MNKRVWDLLDEWFEVTQREKALRHKMAEISRQVLDLIESGKPVPQDLQDQYHCNSTWNEIRHLHDKARDLYRQMIEPS